MLYQPTTNELMDKFNKSINNISELQQDIDSAKAAVKSRLKILDMQYEYLLRSVTGLQDINNTNQNKIVFAETNILDGLYDSYGITIHPKFKKTPSNILNFKTTTGYIFKNNVLVTASNDPETDEVEDTDYLEMLKHDSIESKGYILKEYDNPNLTFTISMEDTKTLGNVNFNVIEVLPYLSGSFDMSIDFYERGAEYPNGYYAQRLFNVAASRIILPSKIEFSKVKFTIKLKFKNSNKYIFGLKHLYFLNASLEEEDSYVVVKAIKTANINYLYDDVLFKTQDGVYSNQDHTLADFNIEVYANYDYDNNVLSRSIEASTKEDPRYISLNLNSLYFKVPITTSTISFVPHIVTD